MNTPSRGVEITGTGVYMCTCGGLQETMRISFLYSNVCLQVDYIDIDTYWTKSVLGVNEVELHIYYDYQREREEINSNEM